jgi:hypothetical protein
VAPPRYLSELSADKDVPKWAKAGGSGCLATHLRTSQRTRQKDCLLNKSERGEASKRIVPIRCLQKDSLVATLGRFWHVPRVRCCLTGSLGLRQHRLLPRHPIIESATTQSRRSHSLPRCAFLLLKPSRPPSSTFLPSTTITPLFYSPLPIKAHLFTQLHPHHTIQDADLRQDP